MRCPPLSSARKPRPVPGGTRGFSLLELVVALLVFQVGLMAVAGLSLAGQQVLRKSHLVLRGTLEARVLADSLLCSGEPRGGEREEPWGLLRWEVFGGVGHSVRVAAMSPGGKDTLAVLRVWKEGVASPPEESRERPEP